MDNLNTHALGALYEALDAEQTQVLATRLEIHYAPKHGSWRNIAEIGLFSRPRQCPSRQVPDIDALNEEIGYWEYTVKVDERAVNLQFTTEDAPIQLRHLYPEH